MKTLRQDADRIIAHSIRQVLPDQALLNKLETLEIPQKHLILIAVGKASWQMAATAKEFLKDRIENGIVITKHGYSKKDIPGLTIYEAGHPVPDKDTFDATAKVLDLVKNLTTDHAVLFLLSGGGSALFEAPLVPEEEMMNITNQLLECGAGIVEINTIRKRLSGVKGGKFALACAPAHVYNIVLSDVIGDPLDMIASGPTVEDRSTCEQAEYIVKKYDLKLSKKAMECIQKETPKKLTNVTHSIIGSVKFLCEAARSMCEELGYRTEILTTSLECAAKDAGSFLSSIARDHQDTKESLAYIAGGETIVYVTGNGKGGRNQELALAAAPAISHLDHVAVFSVGSDGTDGPTDAAGGYVDGKTVDLLAKKGIKVEEILKDNNAYYALGQSGGLIKTGPTGTNVNDVSVVLIRR